MQISKAMSWNRRGFTLIEIMVVIFTVSLFIGLGLPVVMESLLKSNISTMVRNISFFIEDVRSNAIIHKKEICLEIKPNKGKIASIDLKNQKKENTIDIPSDMLMEVQVGDKLLYENTVSLKINKFGFIKPFNIFLKKNNMTFTIKVQGFILENKIYRSY